MYLSFIASPKSRSVRCWEITILGDRAIFSPRDLNAQFPDTEGTIAAGVREALGSTNARITATARTALTNGDAKQLGELMCLAQDTFDRLIAPACPSELQAPRLHRLLTHPQRKVNLSILHQDYRQGISHSVTVRRQ